MKQPLGELVEPCESCGAPVVPAFVTEIASGHTHTVVWDYVAIDEHTPQRCRRNRAPIA